MKYSLEVSGAVDEVVVDVDVVEELDGVIEDEELTFVAVEIRLLNYRKN